MADLLTTVEHDIRERVDELRPVVAEYETLERARQALEESGQSDRSERPPRRASRRPKTAPRNGSKRSATSKRREQAGRGERSKTIVGLLEGNPQITAANIALLLDITPNNVHAIIYRLRKRGVVDKKDGRWVVKGA